MSTAPTDKSSKRVVVLGILACLAVGYTLFDDDGSVVTLARCFATGEGFGSTTLDGAPFERDYFGHSYSGTVDNLIDVQVHLHGAYERPVLQAIEDVLRAKRPQGDAIVVDVGANVGTHTLFLANHAATVHAIEPWPTIFVRLEKTLKSNNIGNVDLHPVGFAAENGTLPFVVPPGFNTGWGSFSSSYAKDHYVDDTKVDLPLVVADEYLAKHGVPRVDLIKVDIEGYEKPALAGFKEYVTRDRPVVFFELNVTNDEGYKSEAELRSSFPDNYKFYRIETEKEFTWRWGKRVAMCGHEVGRYQLVSFPMQFDRDGWNLIAMGDETAQAMAL